MQCETLRSLHQGMKPGAVFNEKICWYQVEKGEGANKFLAKKGD